MPVPLENSIKDVKAQLAFSGTEKREQLMQYELMTGEERSASVPRIEPLLAAASRMLARTMTPSPHRDGDRDVLWADVGRSEGQALSGSGCMALRRPRSVVCKRSLDRSGYARRGGSIRDRDAVLARVAEVRWRRLQMSPSSRCATRLIA
jgi:hypothetical protein